MRAFLREPRRGLRPDPAALSGLERFALLTRPLLRVPLLLRRDDGGLGASQRHHLRGHDWPRAAERAGRNWRLGRVVHHRGRGSFSAPAGPRLEIHIREPGLRSGPHAARLRRPASPALSVGVRRRTDLAPPSAHARRLATITTDARPALSLPGWRFGLVCGLSRSRTCILPAGHESVSCLGPSAAPASACRGAAGAADLLAGRRAAETGVEHSCGLRCALARHTSRCDGDARAELDGYARLCRRAGAATGSFPTHAEGAHPITRGQGRPGHSAGIPGGGGLRGDGGGGGAVWASHAGPCGRNFARLAGDRVGQRAGGQPACAGNPAHAGPNLVQALAANHRCQAVPVDTSPPAPARGCRRRGRSHLLDARDRDRTWGRFESPAGDQRRSPTRDSQSGEPITIGKHDGARHRPDKTPNDYKPEAFAVSESKPLPKYASDRTTDAGGLAEPVSPGTIADATPDSMSRRKIESLREGGSQCPKQSGRLETCYRLSGPTTNERVEEPLPAPCIVEAVTPVATG